MKKLLLGASASLWLGAFSLAPSSAHAVGTAGSGTIDDGLFRTPYLPNNFSCGQYTSIAPYTCNGAQYVGQHSVAYASMCAGGMCGNGSTIDVENGVANGRRTRKATYAICAGAYTFYVDACAACG